MEKEYLELLNDILEHGEVKTDRTGVGTKSVFGRQIRCSLRDGFPLITTKRVPWKPVVGELLWFIEGSSDERRLCEITFGTRDPEKKTIWSANAEYTTGSKYRPKFAGDLGRIYGVQWRSWRTFCWYNGTPGPSSAWIPTLPESGIAFQEIDQLGNIVKTLRANPNDRRMCLTAFNVGEMDQMALPPCHMFAQFYTSQERKELSCQVYIRSNDLFLGLPFNIASYALLTHLMGQVTGYAAGDLIVTIGDAHIYLNHMDQVKEQLAREPFSPPSLSINPNVKEIDDFKMDDISLWDYRSHEAIKAPMAV